MNDNERKDVHDLTNDELRREIFNLTHEFKLVQYEFDTSKVWRAYRKSDGVCVGTVGRYTSDYQTALYNTAIDNGNVPNWPEDDGAAFRLVRDVLDKLKAQNDMWEFTMSDCAVTYHLAAYGGGFRDWIGGNHEGRDARALSELAALALRQMGGDGDE